MKKLNKKKKAKWVKALNSGDFKQGRGALRDGVEGNKAGYCCLGVACKIGIARSREGGLEGAYVSMNFLSDEIQQKLASMNDGGYDSEKQKQMKPKTFKQIAKWIDKNL